MKCVVRAGRVVVHGHWQEEIVLEVNGYADLLVFRIQREPPVYGTARFGGRGGRLALPAPYPNHFW